MGHTSSLQASPKIRSVLSIDLCSSEVPLTLNKRHMIEATPLPSRKRKEECMAMVFFVGVNKRARTARKRRHTN